MKKPVLAPIYFIILVDLLALMAIIPLLPFYAQRFGATTFEIGVLSASFAFFQLVASPYLGKLSDRIGRKPVLLVSQIGTFLGFILMLYAQNFTVLLLARILDGITAGNLPIAQACISDLTDEKERTKAYGKMGVAFGIGLILGPTLSGWLAQYDWTYPIYAASALSLLSIALTAAFLPPIRPVLSLSSSSSFFSLFSQKDLQKLFALFFFFALQFGYLMHGFALILQAHLNYGPSETGWIFGFTGCLGILIQGFLLGKLVALFSEKGLVTAAFGFSLIGYGLFAYSMELPWVLLGCTFFSTGNSLLRPTLTSLVTQTVGQTERGSALGVLSSIQSVGHTVGPLMSGIFLTQSSGTWGLVILGLCIVPLLFQKLTVSFQR